MDDTFVLSKGWLGEFAEEYPKKIGLPFFCNTRANLVTEEQVRLLKKAGAFCVGMGIEARKRSSTLTVSPAMEG